MKKLKALYTSLLSTSFTKWLIGFLLVSVLVPQTEVAVVASAIETGKRPICLYYLSDKVKSPDNLSEGDQLLGNGTVLCNAATDYCFSFWQIKPTNGTELQDKITPAENPGFVWLARGCFKNADQCDRDSCVATEKEIENSFFCCCKGNRCNENISFQEATPTPIVAPDPEEEVSPYSPVKVVIYGILAFVMLILVPCSFVVCFKMRRKKKSISDTSVGFNKSRTSPCIDLNNLKFLAIIGQGRYGTVYKAFLRDEEVAVKLFSHHHKLSFSNEKYIYSLPLMEHSSLLSYFGGGEIAGPDGNPYLGLVLSYCQRGKLSSFLQENTLDWATFCRIVITAVRGLGHLHSDIRKGDLLKPCVAHRDFNTRNILLKEDMSCVVSDLGFAIHTQGAKFYQNGEEQIAEMASLTDVGTLRYMAPEVLEGAVNLRDCETSLKQIDIYALGLVLWEVAYRCHDLYQGTQTPTYALPFEAEIGLRPSFEQMQVLVARNKARPLFPQIWKDTSPAIRQLRETIEDCWDNDAEARLSAMCVERRLIELPKLWTRYKASLGLNSISPTPNPPSANFHNTSDLKSFLISNELSLPKDKETLSQRESSVSENTIETTIPFSPSDPSGRVLGKNQLMEAVNMPPPPPIQPHQGRNPCIERNTISDHPKDLHISGNDLVETSEKYHHSNLELGLNSVTLLEALESRHGIDPQLMSEHLVPLLHSFLPVAPPHQAPLPEMNPPPPPLPPQALPFPSPHVPLIPYVQNEMRAVEGRPKLQNVARERGRRSGWRRFWKTAWEDRLASFLPLSRQRRQYEAGGGEEERRGILVTPTSSSFSEPPTPLSPFDPERGFHQTHVLLSNGAPHTVISERGVGNGVSPPNFRPQPVSLPPEGGSSNNALSSIPPPQRPCLAETEIGIAKLHFQPSLTPIVRSRPGSKDSGINKSSENSNNSFLDSDSSLDRARRPTTLHLHGGQALRHTVVVGTSEEEDLGSDGERSASIGLKVKLRKPKQRVKTPRRPVMPRLSLYDDSVMAGGGHQSAPDMSMSRSLPLEMNNVGKQPDQSVSGTPPPQGTPQGGVVTTESGPCKCASKIAPNGTAVQIRVD